MTTLTEVIAEHEKEPYNSLTASGLVVPGITNFKCKLRELLRERENQL